MTKLTPGVEAWLRALNGTEQRRVEPNDADHLAELGLCRIDWVMTEPIALSHPRRLATVTPTKLAVELHRKLTTGGNQ